MVQLCHGAMERVVTALLMLNVNLPELPCEPGFLTMLRETPQDPVRGSQNLKDFSLTRIHGMPLDHKGVH